MEIAGHMTRDNNSHVWDARSYEKVSSTVQLRWGQELVETRKWLGTEIVMDAGAGSGSVTKVLAGKVPYGRVYAVDADPNMVQQARLNLSGNRNVTIIQSSMEEANLPTPVDVVFSNAALHWVQDLEGTFSHFWQLLRPGGELLIEGGGQGNLDREVSIIFDLMELDRFRKHFVGWKQSWHFLEQVETEKLLKMTGFRDIKVSLMRRRTAFPDRQSFSIFAKTVIMKPFLPYLPDEEKDHFLKAFLDRIEEFRSGWSLDNVRLTISARR